MTRTWTTLCLTALLALTPASGPVAAQSAGPAEPPKPDETRQELDQLRSDTIRSFQAARKDMDALREEVGRLRKDLDDLHAARSPAAAVGGAAQPASKDVDALKEQIARLRQDLDDARNARPSGERIAGYGPPADAGAWRAARKELEDLKEQVAQLHKEVDGWRAALPPVKRTSAYAAPATGSIVLLNTYPADVAIVIDGESYRLTPGERRVLSRPAGAFTYEVVGVQPPVRRTLVAGAAFPIQVHP